jgi:CheY-like chemotaxis protein
LQALRREEDTGLNGVRVFVVEDESLVAMQLEDMLTDLGCEIVGMAMRLKRAQEMLAEPQPMDVAVLDVNLGGEKVYPVAELLRGRGTRIVFATGYGRGGVMPEWQSYPILQKPYTEKQVRETLSQAMALPSAN